MDNRHTQLFASGIIALLIAVGMSLVVTVEKVGFDRTLKQVHKTSEGYDQKYIDMVNHLEDILATRASFGYTGGKDPMTGQVRTVVNAPLTAPPEKSGRSRQANAGAATPAKTPAAPRDVLRLTAIIFDDKEKKFSAIIMDGERSSSVEVGDVVRNRIVRKITNEGIVLDSDTQYFVYDINGNLAIKDK